MAWDIPDSPVSFDEAIAKFGDKLPMTRDEWDSLTLEQQQKAFTVSGVAQLDVVQDVYDSIGRAIDEGTSFADWSDGIDAVLEDAWGGSVENPGWRIETIFRTNVQKAYSEGRYSQATDPDTLEDRPYWMFDAVMDGATTEDCGDANGTVLPADDPFWSDSVPPIHFGCRSTIITLTEEQAIEMGVAEKAPKLDVADGFGAAPGSDDAWAPDEDDYHGDLWNIYKAINE